VSTVQGIACNRISSTVSLPFIKSEAALESFLGRRFKVHPQRGPLSELVKMIPSDVFCHNLIRARLAPSPVLLLKCPCGDLYHETSPDSYWRWYVLLLRMACSPRTARVEVYTTNRRPTRTRTGTDMCCSCSWHVLPLTQLRTTHRVIRSWSLSSSSSWVLKGPLMIDVDAQIKRLAPIGCA